MTSASRPTRDTDNRHPRLLRLADRLAESDTGELRRGADSGPARRAVAFDEPTVTDVKPDAVTTDVVRVVDLPGINPELRAAQSELRRLRSEVAGLVEEVRRLARDADTTVVSARPTAPMPQAGTAPPKPSPTPRHAPAQRTGPTPAARRSTPTPHPRTPVAAPAPAPATWRTVPGQAVTERIVPAQRTAPDLLPAPAPYRPAPPKPSIGRDRPQPAGWRPSPTPAVAPAPAAAPSGLEAGYSAVLAEVLGVAQVPATSNFFDDLGADSLLMARFCARVRSRPDLPNVGIKDIYQAPSIAALAAAGAGAATSSPAAAPSGLEAGYSAVLAEVLGVAQVPATSNFFDDLGADSLLMARFCARVRALPELPNVGIKDIYAAPSIAALAAAGAATSSRSGGGGMALAVPARPPARSSGPDAPTVIIPGGRQDPRTAPVGTLRYLLCGLLQMLFLLGYPALIAYGFAVGEEWVIGAANPLEIYLQSLGVAGALFLGTSLLPILAKWLLVGRWKQGQFPVWSLRYFRFWLVKTLIRTSPLVRFVGTPLYPFYLRLLGAKIGKGVTILSPTVPVCTDLLTIGAGTIIRKASSFSCYRAHDGQIQVGPVTIGADVLVGEATVLDIGSSLGDRSQLGHTSSLHAGMSVPAGERWHGSPAEPTSVNYRAVPTDGRTALRKLLYSLTQLVVLFGVVLPLGLSGLTLLVREVPQVQALFVDIETAAVQVPFVLDVVILSSALFFGGLLLALLAMTTVPRLLAPLVRPNKTYSLYGIAYWALRTITRTTNSKFFTRVFGDSSSIVGYLRALGYRFGRVEQTGSNFGTAVVHDTPFLCEIGSGTVVADGLTILNADYSSTSFKASPVRLGAHSFLGNGIFYPARARVGDNCLLATKVMVPVDGNVRQGVGLLGSPSFEIPRSVERDSRLAVGPEQRAVGLAAKNRHNLVSIALLLLSRWLHFTLLVALARFALDFYPQVGPVAVAAFGTANLLLTYTYFVLLDRAVRWLAARKPQGVSIYDRAFWRHERYWKIAADTYIQRLNGTPFKNGLWRALGVRVGRRLFDDGALMTERVFVTIGDHCTLNERTTIQCHSQENDAFKSDRVVIGNGVSVGVGGFIHYGTRLGDGSLLEADSFLLKGGEIGPRTRWGGNPAVELESEPLSINGSMWRKS